MGLLKGVVKTALLAKAVQIAQREARKPENQRRARELFDKVVSRGGAAARRR